MPKANQVSSITYSEAPENRCYSKTPNLARKAEHMMHVEGFTFVCGRMNHVNQNGKETTRRQKSVMDKLALSWIYSKL